MMARLVRPRAKTPSASDRQQDRVRVPIHGLESLDSGPHISPVEPAAPLDRREGPVRYLGMDVHTASTVWCLLEAQGDVVGELDVRRLQDLLEAVGLLRAVLDQPPRAA